VAGNDLLDQLFFGRVVLRFHTKDFFVL
jgi:hypothetical protein